MLGEEGTKNDKFFIMLKMCIFAHMLPIACGMHHRTRLLWLFLVVAVQIAKEEIKNNSYTNRYYTTYTLLSVIIKYYLVVLYLLIICSVTSTYTIHALCFFA